VPQALHFQQVDLKQELFQATPYAMIFSIAR